MMGRGSTKSVMSIEELKSVSRFMRENLLELLTSRRNILEKRIKSSTLKPKKIHKDPPAKTEPKNFLVQKSFEFFAPFTEKKFLRMVLKEPRKEFNLKELETNDEEIKKSLDAFFETLKSSEEKA